MCICRKTYYLAFSGHDLAFFGYLAFFGQGLADGSAFESFDINFFFNLVPCFIIFTAPPFARRAILVVAYWFLEAR